MIAYVFVLSILLLIIFGVCFLVYGGDYLIGVIISVFTLIGSAFILHTSPSQPPSLLPSSPQLLFSLPKSSLLSSKPRKKVVIISPETSHKSEQIRPSVNPMTNTVQKPKKIIQTVEKPKKIIQTVEKPKKNVQTVEKPKKIAPKVEKPTQTIQSVPKPKVAAKCWVVIEEYPNRPNGDVKIVKMRPDRKQLLKLVTERANAGGKDWHARPVLSSKHDQIELDFGNFRYALPLVIEVGDVYILLSNLSESSRDDEYYLRVEGVSCDEAGVDAIKCHRNQLVKFAGDIWNELTVNKHGQPNLREIGITDNDPNVLDEFNTAWRTTDVQRDFGRDWSRELQERVYVDLGCDLNEPPYPSHYYDKQNKKDVLTVLLKMDRTAQRDQGRALHHPHLSLDLRLVESIGDVLETQYPHKSVFSAEDRTELNDAVKRLSDASDVLGEHEITWTVEFKPLNDDYTLRMRGRSRRLARLVQFLNAVADLANGEINPGDWSDFNDGMKHILRTYRIRELGHGKNRHKSSRTNETNKSNQEDGRILVWEKIDDDMPVVIGRVPVSQAKRKNLMAIVASRIEGGVNEAQYDHLDTLKLRGVVRIGVPVSDGQAIYKLPHYFQVGDLYMLMSWRDDEHRSFWYVSVMNNDSECDKQIEEVNNLRNRND